MAKLTFIILTMIMSSTANVYAVTITPSPVLTSTTIYMSTEEDTVSDPYQLAIIDSSTSNSVRYTLKTVPPANEGVATLSGNILSFMPALNWNGISNFIVEACELSPGRQECVEADVRVTVTPKNDPPEVNDVFITTDEDMTSSLVNVIANDPENDPLTYLINNSGTVGGVGVLNTDTIPPTVSFTPKEHWFGTDSFRITVCDMERLCTDAVAHVEVIPVNDAPMLDNIDISTEEDTATKPYQLTAVDVDSADTITYTLKTQPPATEGEATLNGDILSFMPAIDWNGVSSFIVEACDDNTSDVSGTPACVEATVNVTVTPKNDPHTVTIAPLVTNEDTPVIGVPTIVDPDDGDTYTLRLVTPPLNGIARLNPVQGVISFSYAPSNNWYGRDQFELQVCDQVRVCASLPVSVEVTPVNDPPSVTELSIIAKKNTQSEWVTPTVLDPDPNQTFSFSIVDTGRNLSVFTDSAYARISVLPHPEFAGNTTFTYKACDQDGACLEATATVKVIDDLYHKDGKGGVAEIALVSGGYPKVDNGQYPVTSQSVVRDAGTEWVPVTGRYDLEVHWDTMIQGVSLDVMGQTVTSNSSIRINGYDFSNNDSRVVLPTSFAYVNPTAPTGSINVTAPTGPIGELFIRVIDPNTGQYAPLIPNIRIPVAAWDLADNISFNVDGASDPSGAVAKMVEEVVVRASLTGTHHCGAGLLVWDPVESGKYVESQSCGIQWTSLPEGMSADAYHVAAPDPDGEGDCYPDQVGRWQDEDV